MPFEPLTLPRRTAPRLGFTLPVFGYGAFKIGRNQGIKYPTGYELPTDAESDRLLNALLDAGVDYFDTAPAYGISEERIGRALSQRRSDFRLSTKVGETFIDGRSVYRFDAASVRESITDSLRKLKTDRLDLVFIHSDGNDLDILKHSDALPTLLDLKASGVIAAVGFSGKTVPGARAALENCDALMVEYHTDDVSHRQVLREAAARGLAVVVKKGLASGRLPAGDSIRFVLGEAAVTSLVVGGLTEHHLQANLRTAAECGPVSDAA